jgi:hypothetical protein
MFYCANQDHTPVERVILIRARSSHFYSMTELSGGERRHSTSDAGKDVESHAVEGSG